MSRVTIQPSGKTVEVASGDTVLMALEKAGYALPNNCRAGACGECKVKVLSGEYDQGMVLDMALSSEERCDGFGLMCMAKPTTEELMIEWGTADARPKLFAPRENALFVVTDKRPVAARAVELHLRPVGQPIRYWPGQYVTVGDPRGGVPARAYSVSNAPRADGELILHVARADGGTTSAWIHDQLGVGESIKINGPYGTFIGDPAVDTPVLCLAAGTGLAPILALTEAALRRGFRKPVMLLLSARTREDAYAQGLMAWWRTKHRNFDYRVTLTREEAEGFWHGRVDAVLPGLLPNLAKHTVFAAGSPEFTASCVQTAKALGAGADMIYTEGFFAMQQPTVADREHLLPG